MRRLLLLGMCILSIQGCTHKGTDVYRPCIVDKSGKTVLTYGNAECELSAVSDYRVVDYTLSGGSHILYVDGNGTYYRVLQKNIIPLDNTAIETLKNELSVKNLNTVTYDDAR